MWFTNPGEWEPFTKTPEIRSFWETSPKQKIYKSLSLQCGLVTSLDLSCTHIPRIWPRYFPGIFPCDIPWKSKVNNKKKQHLQQKKQVWVNSLDYSPVTLTAPFRSGKHLIHLGGPNHSRWPSWKHLRSDVTCPTLFARFGYLRYAYHTGSTRTFLHKCRFITASDIQS